MADDGLVIVVSAPSGAGKRTVLSEVLRQDCRLALATSATTRPPREDEVEGRDYFFLPRDAFKRRVESDAFVEWAEVHGNLYGTPKEELERLIASGSDAVLEVDVQGMRSLRANLASMVPGARVVTIFIMPPSIEELERRIRKRAANDEQDMALRLRNARKEMAARNEFDHIVVNDDLNDAVREVLRILTRERLGRA